MVLLLGTHPTDDSQFSAINIPDEYSPLDVMPVVVEIWGNPDAAPSWVSSDSEAMAAAASAEFDGAPIRPLPGGIV